jgi:predicted nucleic acid-binding protein
MATAKRTGCTIFFSEDMQHGRSYDGLTVMNPFKMNAQEIDDVLR